MNGLISVIVPVYNGEKYLDKCIKSIVDQTYKNLEILLIDDNSSDGSFDIEDSWQKKDKRIVIIRNNAPGAKHGTPVARNIGLDNAKGSLIAFSDDDDTMKPNMLERLYELMIQYDAQISFCSREIISSWYVESYEDKGISVFKNGCVDIDKLANEFDFDVVWVKLYRKELFAGIRFPEDMIYGDDSFPQTDLYSKCKCIVYTSEQLYNYSFRNDNNTLKIEENDEKYWNLMKLHRKIFDYSVKFECNLQLPIRRMYYYYRLCIYNCSKKSYQVAVAEYKEWYNRYKSKLPHNIHFLMLYYFPTIKRLNYQRKQNKIL